MGTTPHRDADQVHEAHALRTQIAGNERDIVLNFGSPKCAMQDDGDMDIEAIEYHTRVHLDPPAFAELCRSVSHVAEQMGIEFEDPEDEASDPATGPGFQ